MKHINNSDFYKFARNFIILFVILLVLDYAIGTTLKHYYFKQKSGLLYRTTYSIDSTKANFVVFGSSRANHHYVPSVFENKFNTTFYNCGRDGCNMIYSVAVLSAVVDRYKPKQIVFDFIPGDLGSSEEDKLSPLLPYRNNPAIKPYIKYNSQFEKYKLLSKMYPYNSLLTNIIVGNLAANKKRSMNEEGYVALDKIMPDEPKKVFEAKPIIPLRAKILDDILFKLNQKQIPVVVVISPSYLSYKPDNAEAVTIKNICSKYNNAKFINYENSPDFDDHQLFSDNFHLNNTGAIKFSKDLSARLMN